MDQLLEKFASHCGSLTHYTVKTAARTAIAKEYLSSPEGRSAVVLIMSLRNLYGIDVLYWEPDTIWLTLERDSNIILSAEARDKIQAGISLIRNPAFYWDNLVFQRTCQSLNSELYDAETLQECHPGHMAWAIYEASLLRGHDPDDDALPELDEDVQQYAAVCLQRAGYVYPPSQLKSVADNLRHLLPSEKGPFIDEVKKTWDRLDKGALLDRNFQEDPIGIQLAQLASCYIYVKEEAEKLATDVLQLDTGVTT
jgi:hypothetical protein